MAYSDRVVKRFENVLKNPEKHSVGRFDPNDPNIGTGMVGAPACGDVMRLQLQVEKGIINDVKFKTYGCGSAIASSSIGPPTYQATLLRSSTGVYSKSISRL